MASQSDGATTGSTARADGSFSGGLFDLSAELDGQLDDESRKMLDLMQSILDNHGTLGDIKGLGADHQEAIYAVAHQLYEQEKYQDAHALFSFLCLYNHLTEKFWYGLGACRHMMKNYKGAIDAYSMAAMLDMENPDYPLFAAECHLALGNLTEAENGAFAAALWAKERGDQTRRLRAEALTSVIAARIDASTEG